MTAAFQTSLVWPRFTTLPPSNISEVPTWIPLS